MDCEREDCGHPLSLHDPCTAKKCACRAYEPAGRKARVASLTDIVQRAPVLADTRADELQRTGRLS